MTVQEWQEHLAKVGAKATQFEPRTSSSGSKTIENVDCAISLRWRR